MPILSFLTRTENGHLKINMIMIQEIPQNSVFALKPNAKTLVLRERQIGVYGINISTFKTPAWTNMGFDVK